MVSTKKNEEAVSPVIGVILMVAVTVILAAIIAAFVFGMAGNVQSSKTIGLTMIKNGTGYGIITVQGGPDLPTLSKINYTVNGGAETAFTVPAAAPINAGKVIVGPLIAAGDRILIIGHFSDGATQILIDKQY